MCNIMWALAWYYDRDMHLIGLLCERFAEVRLTDQLHLCSGMLVKLHIALYMHRLLSRTRLP